MLIPECHEAELKGDEKELCKSELRLAPVVRCKSGNGTEGSCQTSHSFVQEVMSSMGALLCGTENCQVRATVGLFEKSAGFFEKSAGFFEKSVGFFEKSVGLFEKSVGFFEKSVGFFEKSVGFFEKSTGFFENSCF